MGVGNSAQELVKKDLEAIYLGNLQTVEFDLEFPKMGENGSEISWRSGNTEFLSHDGKVTRPAYGRGNREIVLTACARLGDYEDTREFFVTVLEYNNRVEVEEIYPICLQADPGQTFYLPQASAVRTKNGRVIAQLIEWDGGMERCFEAEGIYLATGHLKESGFPVQGSIWVSKARKQRGKQSQTGIDDKTVIENLTGTESPKGIEKPTGIQSQTCLESQTGAGSQPATENQTGRGSRLARLGSSVLEMTSGSDSRDHVSHDIAEAVTLLPGSRFYEAQEHTHTWLLHSDPDTWLYHFRKTAGLPVSEKTEPPGGWDSQDGLLRGHTTGHYLSSLALCYRATKDETIKKTAIYMAKELKKCQDAFSENPQYHKGFLSAYSEEQFDLLEVYTPYPKIWAPYYTLHKILSGLLDLYDCVGIETARITAEGVGDWVYARLSRLSHEQRARMWSIYIAGEYGGMNEAMARLYGLTGKDTYLQTAHYFDNDRLFYPLEQGVDALDGMHANQHIPQVVGAMRLYSLTGEARYAEITKRFWANVTGSHIYAPGGTGESEMFHEPGNITGLLTASTQESCASYNMLKLTGALYSCEQTAAYMDYYERTVYNHILSTCDKLPTAGSIYFLSMKPKSVKEFDTTGNSCCHGTGLESHFKYGEYIYFVTEDAIFVNLFIPSVLRLPNLELTLKVEEENPGALHISWKGRLEKTLLVRVPRWVVGDPSVRLNGSAEVIDAKVENGYLKIEPEGIDLPGRTTDLSEKNSEAVPELLVIFPCGLYYEPAKDQPRYRTLWYGPWLLAALTGQEDVLCLPDGDPSECFSRETSGNISFREKTSGICFIPLADVWKEEYQVYLSAD